MLTYLYGIFIIDSRGYLLINFAAERTFPQLKPDFRAMIDSFRVSP